MASKVTEYVSGKKRVLEITLASGEVLKLRIMKSTRYETNLPSNKSLCVEPNSDGTYRMSFGAGLFNDLDDIVSIKITRQDFT